VTFSTLITSRASRESTAADTRACPNFQHALRSGQLKRVGHRSNHERLRDRLAFAMGNGLSAYASAWNRPVQLMPQNA